jgi:hypothetical protein
MIENDNIINYYSLVKLEIFSELPPTSLLFPSSSGIVSKVSIRIVIIEPEIFEGNGGLSYRE